MTARPVPSPFALLSAVSLVAAVAGCATEGRFFAGRLPYGFTAEVADKGADPFNGAVAEAASHRVSSATEASGLAATEASLAALRRPNPAPARIAQGRIAHGTSSPALGLGRTASTGYGHGTMKPTFVTRAAPRSSAPIGPAPAETFAPRAEPAFAAVPAPRVAPVADANPFAAWETERTAAPIRTVSATTETLPVISPASAGVVPADFRAPAAPAAPVPSAPRVLDERLWEPVPEVPADDFVLPTR